MKKKLGLMVLAGASLLVPSCGRQLLRKTAAQLVATYTQFDISSQDTIDMIKEVKMSWNYSKTDEDIVPFARFLVYTLTGETEIVPSKTITLAKENYAHFFEFIQLSSVSEEVQHKDYINDITKWNLFTSDTYVPDPAKPLETKTIAVFDSFFPEEYGYKFQAKVNDLYISGPIHTTDTQGTTGIIGNGSYHYDSYGRLVSANVGINYSTEYGKVILDYNVNATYNSIKS